MRWLVLLAVVGCTSPDPVPEDTCSVQFLEPCPDCGPGEVRGGLAAQSIRDLASAPDGNLTARICNQDSVLDRELALVAQTPHEEPPFLEGLSSAAWYWVTEHNVYVMTDGAFIAYTADGVERWQRSFTGNRPGVTVAPEGPYLAGAGGIVALTHDGGVRWTAAPVTALVADGTGGVFTRTVPEPASNAQMATATIAHLDATGTTVWTKTITARQPIQGYAVRVRVTLMAPTAAGGVVIAGHFVPTLELDTIMLSGTNEQVYVAMFDATGAVTWAHMLENARADSSRYLGSLAVLGEDAAVTFSDLDDASLVRVGAGGVERTVRFGGLGEQGIGSLVVGEGDEVFMTARSANNDTEPEYESQLTIDGQSLGVDEGFYMSYVLKMQL